MQKFTKNSRRGHHRPADRRLGGFHGWTFGSEIGNTRKSKGAKGKNKLRPSEVDLILEIVRKL